MTCLMNLSANAKAAENEEPSMNPISPSRWETMKKRVSNFMGRQEAIVPELRTEESESFHVTL